MGWVNQCGVVFKKVNKHTTLKPLVLGPKKIPLGQKFILATCTAPHGGAVHC